MFKILRKLRHKKEIKNLFIWIFLGQFYRFLIKLLPFNFYINQKITNSFNFRLHAFFAFSTASFTSFTVANFTSALCSPVAGLKTFPVLIDSPPNDFPLTKCSIVLMMYLNK